MKLASFDIFDTVLIRKCGKPENIFYLMAEKLFPDDEASRDDFVLWRRQAERNAQKHNKKELRIEEIYKYSRCTSYSSKELLAVEKSIEKENLVANPEIVQKIVEYRSHGWQIAFISDMYLDADFLREILLEQGCYQEGDSIFVSCEHNARKSTVKLYDIVKKELTPGEWRHHGDNLHSDVKMAKLKGIHATLINSSFRDIEKTISSEGKIFRDDWKMSLLAGFSRKARLASNDEPYSRIAADYVAPAYIPYVVWVLSEAKKTGMERLYFLSRDSYILMKIAEQLPHEGIELRYLFLSRKSLLLPYLKDCSVETYLRIIDKHTLIRKRVKDLLLQLQIGPKELEQYGITFDYSQITTSKQSKDFLNKVFHSEYTKVLQKRIESEVQLLTRYFHQEGLFDSKKSAMVDVGWLGTTRHMVNQILRNAGGTDVDFFYYGVRGDVFPMVDGRYQTYFKGASLSTEATGLIENYMSASPYPSTIGYEEGESGLIKPKFANDETPCENTIVKANVQSCIAIASEISKHNCFSEEQLFLWCKSAIEALSKLKYSENLLPFRTCSDMDGSNFVKKYSLLEVFRFLAGYHLSVFDLASAEVSFGRPLRRLVWPVHSFMGRVQHFVLTRFVMKK